MDRPLELVFRNMKSSKELKALVEERAERLEQIYQHIIGCRVTIEMPHKSHRVGSNAPDVHIVLRVPGREIVVSRELSRGANQAAQRVGIVAAKPGRRCAVPESSDQAMFHTRTGASAFRQPGFRRTAVDVGGDVDDNGLVGGHGVLQSGSNL